MHFDQYTHKRSQVESLIQIIISRNPSHAVSVVCTLKLSGMVVVDHVMQLHTVIPTVITASKQLQHTHKSAKLAHTKLVAINAPW